MAQAAAQALCWGWASGKHGSRLTSKPAMAALNSVLHLCPSRARASAACSCMANGSRDAPVHIAQIHESRDPE